MSTAPRSANAKRSWGDDDSASTILHADMDSFFASVEIVEDRSLAGRPLIIGGRGERGVVTSCTYDVRARGVKAGMPIARARALSPNAIVVSGHHGLYKNYSSRVMRIMEATTPAFEPVSIDEAYLDVSGAIRRLGPPTSIAQLLRDQVRQETGLPMSVGIAATKMAAKIASSHAKPDGLLLIPGDATLRFLHSLPVGAIPGVGKRSTGVLEGMGIMTIAQLHKAPLQMLARKLGEAHARALKDAAAGIDNRKVGARTAEKSISTEETFDRNLTNPRAIEAFFLRASHSVAARLRRLNLTAWTVQIKLRDASFKTITRSSTLTAPTDLSRTISSVAIELFRRQPMPQGGIRLAGVGAASLSGRESGVQVALDEDPRPLATERAMDAVNNKFGFDSLRPATLLEH